MPPVPDAEVAELKVTVVSVQDITVCSPLNPLAPLVNPDTVICCKRLNGATACLANVNVQVVPSPDADTPVISGLVVKIEPTLASSIQVNPVIVAVYGPVPPMLVIVAPTPPETVPINVLSMIGLTPTLNLSTVKFSLMIKYVVVKLRPPGKSPLDWNLIGSPICLPCPVKVIKSLVVSTDINV